MAGDFIPDPDSTSSPITDELPSTSVPTSDLLRSLTPRQGDRLLTHLDDRLLSLERDERKQGVSYSSSSTSSPPPPHDLDNDG